LKWWHNSCLVDEVVSDFLTIWQGLLSSECMHVWNNRLSDEKNRISQGFKSVHGIYISQFWSVPKFKLRTGLLSMGQPSMPSCFSSPGRLDSEIDVLRPRGSLIMPMRRRSVQSDGRGFRPS
jgi:hypothetical protein